MLNNLTQECFSFGAFLRFLTTLWLLAIITLYCLTFDANLAPGDLPQILFATLIEGILTLFLFASWALYQTLNNKEKEYILK
jgi:hypothetical protein